MLAPAVVGAVIAGVTYLAVGWAKCRNRWLAACVGALAGAAAFLGYFYVSMLHILPPGNAHRIDLFPDFIVARMQTDVIGNFGRQNNGPPKPTVFLNWGTFLFELGICSILPAATAWTRAQRAYCAELRQWLSREVALFPPYSGPELIETLGHGGFEEVVALHAMRNNARPEESKLGTSDAHANFLCKLTLEYVAVADQSVLTHPVYLSLEDQRPQRRWYQTQYGRTVLFRQVTLSTDEILTLCPLFPHLAATLAEQHSELGKAVASPAYAVRQLSDTSEVACIEAVPPPFHRRVRTRSYALKVNLLGLVPLLFLFGGMALIGAGIYLLDKGSIGMSIGAFVFGSVSAAWGLYVALWCPSVFENRWIEKRLRREIDNRPNVLVASRDPDAIVVSLVPREHFTKIKLTLSTDLLLMKIDDVTAPFCWRVTPTYMSFHRGPSQTAGRNCSSTRLTVNVECNCGWFGCWSAQKTDCANCCWPPIAPTSGPVPIQRVTILREEFAIESTR